MTMKPFRSKVKVVIFSREGKREEKDDFCDSWKNHGKNQVLFVLTQTFSHPPSFFFFFFSTQTFLFTYIVVVLFSFFLFFFCSFFFFLFFCSFVLIMSSLSSRALKRRREVDDNDQEWTVDDLLPSPPLPPSILDQAAISGSSSFSKQPALPQLSSSLSTFLPPVEQLPNQEDLLFLDDDDEEEGTGDNGWALIFPFSPPLLLLLNVVCPT